jgi:hypothetical protein
MAVFYRRLFFWIVALLFLITAPVAVLYSKGYRFDQYKKIFIHSGSITVKSTPPSVSIYLNGDLQPSGTLDIINNSITINGLRPGNYNLKVAKDGYKIWEKNVEVHSGVSTEFWNVFLIPQNFAPKELAADKPKRFFVSPFGENIAYVKKNGTDIEIYSLKVKDNESEIIFSQNNADFPDDPFENVEWNSKEKLFIAPLLIENRKDFFILDSEKKQESISLLQMTGFSQIKNVRWSSNGKNEIYFAAKPEINSQNNLYKINPETKSINLILEEINGAYDLSGNSIYFLQGNNIIYITDLEGKNEKQLTFSPAGALEDDKKIRLIAYDEDRQAVIFENGELYINNRGEKSDDTLKKISDSVKSVQFSDDGKKLLFWNDNEINVLYLRKWDVQPRREENEIQQIARLSSPLKNVFWYRDYEHIFFSTQDSVKIIELDSRDRRIVDDIFKYNSEYFLSSYDSANGIYYYSDEISGIKKLFYLYIPEETSFFGG